MTQPSPHSNELFWYKLKKILVPLLIGTAFGFLTYYGGEAYRKIGLEGIGTAQIVLGYIIGISEFLILAVALQRIVQYIILDWLFSSTVGSTAPRLLSQLSAFIIYLIAITAIIGIVFKKDLTVILAASGAAGIVIGMALRELILDIFAGLALNLDRTIKIGDNIYFKAMGETVEGTVKEISWRTTQIFTKFYNTMIIPNSRISTAIVTNYSLPKPFFKIKLMVTLDFAVPNDRAIRVLQSAALEATEQFLTAEAPQPSATIAEIMPDGVRYIVSIYPSFPTRTKARSQTFQTILRHLTCAGLTPSLSRTEGLELLREKIPNISNQPDSIHIAKLIGDVSLFKDFTNEDKQKLATLVTLNKIKADTFITHAGEVATSMFLLVEGLLLAESIQRGKGGKTTITKIVSPGNLIGGEVMLLGSTYELSIKTRTASLLCEINHQSLGGLLAHQPILATKLSKRVAKQLTSKVTQIETGNQQQWQMSEADLAAEVFRNLQRSFSL